ncbi:MAG TPA: hypothetical protein VNQ76_11645 [Planctomicrobium sp.]|nr:hypothetical protein [Planctomicrobium sp.]
MQLVRAYESLGKHFDLAETNLGANIDPIRKSAVDLAISEAVKKVKTISQGSTALERTSLERIAGRIRGVCGKEKAFGVTVKSIAERFGFADCDILDGYYRINPICRNSTWPGVLSLYRGAVIHEGYFAFGSAGSVYSIQDVISVIDHLEDLLIRVLLRMIGYDGPYRSTIRGNLMPVLIDWVYHNQPASDLGFGIDRNA